MIYRNFVLILLIISYQIFSSFDSKKIDEKQVQNNFDSIPYFVTGLKNTFLYSHADTTDYGTLSFNYNFNSLRNFKVKYWFDQTNYVFSIIDETNFYSNLNVKFDLGFYESELLQSARLQIGQYDFDGDDIDELVLAVQENNSGTNCMNGICLNIFKLKRCEWERIGDLTGECIVGDYIPRAKIKVNKITIPRNLRGFFYQWTFINDRFENTGFY